MANIIGIQAKVTEADIFIDVVYYLSICVSIQEVGEVIEAKTINILLDANIRARRKKIKVGFEPSYEKNREGIGLFGDILFGMGMV